MTFYTRHQSVYLAGVPSGYIKIGVASNPEARIREMQTGCPEKISFLGGTKVSDGAPVSAFQMEQLLHHKMAGRRVRGEWFRVSLAEMIDIWTVTYRFLAVPFDRPLLGVFADVSRRHGLWSVHLEERKLKRAEQK
jgi:hypothetical protein